MISDSDHRKIRNLYLDLRLIKGMVMEPDPDSQVAEVLRYR